MGGGRRGMYACTAAPELGEARLYGGGGYTVRCFGPATAVAHPEWAGLPRRWGKEFLCSPSRRGAKVPQNRCGVVGEGLGRTDGGKIVHSPASDHMVRRRTFLVLTGMPDSYPLKLTTLEIESRKNDQPRTIWRFSIISLITFR